MIPNIHVGRNQVVIGIFTEEQVAASLAQGIFRPDDHCWTEGMAEWKTLGAAFPHLVAASSAKTIPGQQPASLEYASAGDRFGAYLLDGLFMSLMVCGLYLPFYFIVFAATGLGDDRHANPAGSLLQLAAIFISCIVSLVYHGSQGNSRESATWGQRIMGFRMVDAMTGSAPRSGQIWKWAAFRSLILSCCSCVGWLFFIPILSDERKQSLFDQWADILMVKK